MGTTINSIHVYSEAEVTFPDVEFAEFSPNWHTVVSSKEEPPLALARKMSKSLQAPILHLSTFDSDGIWLSVFQNGRTVAQFSDLYQQSKGIYQIPGLFGYASGEKRRISRILSCGDFDLKIALLEEFLGVCLLPFPEVAEEHAGALKRTRGEALYLEFLAEEKKLSGKNAPIKVSLVYQTCGKLFENTFDHDMRFYKPGCYYFGYDTEESGDCDGNLRPVRFTNGNLVPISEEEMLTGQIPRTAEKEWYRIDSYSPKFLITCNEEAPAAFAGKTLELPRGLYPMGFDGKARMYLSNDHGSVAVMDSDNKIISRFTVKGAAVMVDGEYILAAGSQSFYAYLYNPNDYIRIYRITDGT